MTISGTNCLAGALVLFQAILACAAALSSATQIRAVPPPDTADTVDVGVPDLVGEPGKRAKGFSYTAAPPASGPWKVVWDDEFDATSLDTSKWSYVEKAGGIAYYTSRPQNVSVSGGYLKLAALKDNYTSPDGVTHPYTSGYIISKYRGDWTYGAFEVRAKLPAGQGMHPAIWMLPTDSVYGPWPNSGEIDIMESEGSTINSVYGTIHYGAETIDNGFNSANSESTTYTLPSGDFSDGFHVFRLEWEPTQIRWYVDGVLYSTQTNWFATGYPYPAPLDQRFYLILNLAMVSYTGGPDATTPFPKTITVDYVRVYQKNCDERLLRR